MIFQFFLFRSLSILTVVLLAPGSFALAECGNPATAKELLDCVMKSDPRVLASEERVKRAEALARAAGAWPNPEAEGEVSFPEGGSGGKRISASISQSLDYSGKLGNNQKAAQMEWEAQKSESRLLRQEVLAETVVRLVRLKQIEHERGIMEGQVKLCERGLGRFAKLAFLTSEQQTERKALEWSSERLRLQILDLGSEDEEIRLELSVSLGGHEFPQGLSIQSKDKWPDWPAVSASPSFLLAEKYRRESAQAEVGREGAAAWPALSLGPVFEREEDSSSGSNFWGGKLSLELPFWTRNEGNRDAAESSLREAKTRESSSARRLDLTRRLFKNRYEKAIGSLASLEKKVESGGDQLEPIRAGYLSGRVSLPLALEAYRELEELIEHYHETERAAYGALWRGYALEDIAETQEP